MKIYACIYINIYAFIYMNIYACIYMNIYACIHMNIYAYIYEYIYESESKGGPDKMIRKRAQSREHIHKCMHAHI